MSSINIKGEIRRFVRTALGGGEKLVRMTGLESLATALVEPRCFEVSRAGLRFGGGTQLSANGIAPTTSAAAVLATAPIALVNVHSTKIVVMERANAFLLTGTAAAGSTLLVSVSPAPIAAPPTAHATGYGALSLSGKQIPTARWQAACVFPQAPNVSAWMAISSTGQAAAANFGQGASDGVDLEGSILVPPGHAIGFAMLSGAGTTPLYGISAQWCELESDLD